MGLVSALLGIGGGLLLVPFMVLALGFEQHLAQGTSLAVIIPTAMVGAVAHHRRGFVEFRPAVLMVGGGIAGVYAGSQIALGIDGGTLRAIFGVVVVVLGIRMVAQGVQAERSGARQG